MNNKIICKLNVKRAMCLLLSVLLILAVVNTRVSADDESYGTLSISTTLKGDDAPSGDILRYHITSEDNTGAVIYDLWVSKQNENGGSGELTTSIKVPLNFTYTVKQVLPTGYGTSGDVSKNITIDDSSTTGALDFACNYNSAGYFKTHQEAQNQAEVENIYSVEATAQLDYFEPIDVILLLDYSSSMTEILGEGKSRFEAMKEAVLDFLDQFAETVNTDTDNTHPSRIGVVLFGESVELIENKMYKASEINDLITEINAITPPPSTGNGTPTDLALSKAYETFHNYDSINYSQKRNVLLFTDGLPGDMSGSVETDGGNFPILYGPIDRIYPTRHYLAQYKYNSYRVAAESLNQANALKGSGTVTTNESFTGSFYSVTDIANIGLDSYLGDISFYGVNPDNDDTWPSISNNRESVSNIADITDANVPFATAKDAYENGINGGNKDRSAKGMEASITTIAMVDTGDLSSADKDQTERLFSELSSDGAPYYVNDLNSLKEAFEKALSLIESVSGVYIAVNLGSEYQPLGGTLNISTEGGKGNVKEIITDTVNGEHIVYVYLDKMFCGDEETIIKILVIKKSNTVFVEDQVGIYYSDDTALDPDLIKAVSCKIIA